MELKILDDNIVMMGDLLFNCREFPKSLNGVA